MILTEMPATSSRERSLAQLLLEHPAADDQPLVYCGDIELSAGVVRRAAKELSGLMRAGGTRPGSVVADLVGGGPNSLVVMYAVWLAGAVYMPCNDRLTDPEIVQMMDEAPPSLVVGASERLDALGVTATRILESGTLEWTAGRDGTDPGHLYDRDVALVMRTSGTTGRAKAVLLRHSGTLEGLDAILDRIRSGSTRAPRDARTPTPNLIPVSLALWAGIYNTLFAFRAGAPIVVIERFSTDGFRHVIGEFDIRSTVLAPAMITMLNDDPLIEDLKPLRFVRSITAPLRKDEAERFFARFSIPVLNSYGQTELGGEVVGWTAADVREFGASKLGSVGRPHGGVGIEVRGEDGSLLGADETGEIWVHSPFLMRGYATDPEALSDRLSEEGFLRTGDIGSVDADGFLWIHGRESDMINRGGMKVSPEEVEAVLVGHPDVVDACVAGIFDARLGEVPFAWVVPGGAFDPGALADWCRQRLAPYKVPVGFEVIDAVPRSEIGKVLRRSLASGRQSAT